MWPGYRSASGLLLSLRTPAVAHHNLESAEESMKILLSVRIVSGLLFVAWICLLSSAHAQQPPAAPGRLVDLGGRRLRLNCTGAGSPTVIAESGSGAFSIDWALVQPAVARFTRFCSYDRAGYAWSDPGPVRDSVEQTVDDFHLLLQTADIRPPYILVGASLGGLYIRAYQRRYPDQIIGLIFDDATTEKSLGFPIGGKNKFITDISSTELHDLFAPLLRNPPPSPQLPNSIEAPFDRLPQADKTAWLWAIRKFISDADVCQSLVSAESWREEFIALQKQKLRQIHPLGNLPLIVLVRTQDADESHTEQASQLAGLSIVGKLVTAANSGHEIHLYRPDVVVNSIHEVVMEARNEAAQATR
jgi:pimeloyl-ACP methyl ester carboxylesterase